jgi:hypothetical protein
MKNLIATAGCALVIGLSSTFAQQDSTRDREQAKRVKQPNETNRSRYQRTDETRKSSTNSSSTDENQNSTQNQSNTKREMVIVQPSEIPSSLRETLADPKYEGWENAVIYHNTRTDEYIVSPRPHRFNSEGKEMSYGMTGDNRSGRSYGQTGNPNRSSGSVNQHRRMSGNSTSGNNSSSESDRSNTYGTNQNQDSTRMNGTQSSSSSNQDRQRSGQSSSYRNDSTQMNNSNSNNSQNNNSQNMNSDRNRSDSSRTNGGNNSNSSSGRTSSNNSYTSSRVEDQNLPTEGMVLVEEQDVPSKLKATLRDSDYSGWERGKLYQNPATGEYILVMGGSESGSDEQRSYRFDKEGKVIKDTKMNGRGQE